MEPSTRSGTPSAGQINAETTSTGVALTKVFESVFGEGMSGSDLLKVLEYIKVEPSDLKSLQAEGFEADKSMRPETFFNFLYRKDQVLQRLQQVLKEAIQLASEFDEIKTEVQDSLFAASGAVRRHAVNMAGGLRVLSWNVMSSSFAVNPLEFKPADDYLAENDQKALNSLLQKANKWILDPESSPKLSKILTRSKIEEFITDLETAPITKVPEKLGAYLESHKSSWPSAWRDQFTKADDEVEQATKLFCNSHWARWDFWEDRTIYEFFCDDQSGGVANDKFPAKDITVDSTSWDLGFSSADRVLGNKTQRCKRAWWLGLAGAAGDDEPVPSGKVGKHDFFKLLIFDLLIAQLLEGSGLEQKELERLARALLPEPADTRMAKVVERVKAKADVAILLEVPVSGGPLEDGLKQDFWTIRADDAAAAGHHGGDFGTMICARKSKFHEPDVASGIQTFKDDTKTMTPRMVACDLKLVETNTEMHFIGVHLPGRSKKIESYLAEQLEAAIKPHTVVLAGDFNVDLRNKKTHDGLDQFPKLSRFLHQVSQNSQELASLASTCKERMPFQAQITKIGRQDCTMKDYLFLGMGFEAVRAVGYVNQTERLPNEAVPSDHADLFAALGVCAEERK